MLSITILKIYNIVFNLITLVKNVLLKGDSTLKPFGFIVYESIFLLVSLFVINSYTFLYLSGSFTITPLTDTYLGYVLFSGLLSSNPIMSLSIVCSLCLIISFSLNIFTGLPIIMNILSLSLHGLSLFSYGFLLYRLSLLSAHEYATFYFDSFSIQRILKELEYKEVINELITFYVNTYSSYDFTFIKSNEFIASVNSLAYTASITQESIPSIEEKVYTLLNSYLLAETISNITTYFSWSNLVWFCKSAFIVGAITFTFSGVLNEIVTIYIKRSTGAVINSVASTVVEICPRVAINEVNIKTLFEEVNKLHAGATKLEAYDLNLRECLIKVLEHISKLDSKDKHLQDSILRIARFVHMPISQALPERFPGVGHSLIDD